MNHLVSILIPCYNGEQFLKRCFESLLSQIYNGMEIIFVNDGSYDNSEIISKKYGIELEKRGNKFIYLYQENLGAAAAINSALKLVTCKYIMLFDVDDIIFPTAVSDKLEFLENNPTYDMVRNNGYYVNNDNLNKIIGCFSDDDKEKNNEKIFEALLLGETNNWPGSFMVRSKALFENISNREIYKSQFGQNLQIMLPVAYNGKSGYIDKPLMKYIRHNKSHSAFSNYKRKLELFNGYEENRIQIINTLNMDEHIRDEYIKKINIVYYRIRMKIAYESNNKKLLIEQFNKLKSTNKQTKKDITLYRRGRYKSFDNLIKLYELLLMVNIKLRRDLFSD